ncbi:MAG: hypothetical protein H7Y38_16455 [Armatimonadetes bacterium]|nr:hypothetical protein [Armatimonadota bacterium]
MTRHRFAATVAAGIAFLGLLPHSATFAAGLFSDLADGEVSASVAAGGIVDGGGSVGSTGPAVIRSGGPNGDGNAGGNTYNNVVLPFQLPSLGAVAAPFTGATFTAFSAGGDNIFGSANMDLYGLGVRTSPTILGSDFYLGGAPDTTDAILIQDNYRGTVGGSSPADGTAFSTNATGDAALLAYLNVQYASGANAGNYVFLRVSPDNTDIFFKYQSFHAADDANAAVRPVITYTAAVVVPETGALPLLLMGLGSLPLGIALRRRLAH